MIYSAQRILEIQKKSYRHSPGLPNQIMKYYPDMLLSEYFNATMTFLNNEKPFYSGSNPDISYTFPEDKNETLPKLYQNVKNSIKEKNYDFFFKTTLIVTKYTKPERLTLKGPKDLIEKKFSLTEDLYLYKTRYDPNIYCILERDFPDALDPKKENSFFVPDPNNLNSIKKYIFPLTEKKLLRSIIETNVQMEKQTIYKTFFHFINPQLENPYPQKIPKVYYLRPNIQSKTEYDFFTLYKALLQEKNGENIKIKIPNFTIENGKFTKEEKKILETALQKAFFIEFPKESCCRYISLKDGKIDYTPWTIYDLYSYHRITINSKPSEEGFFEKKDTQTAHEKIHLKRYIKNFLESTKML